MTREEARQQLAGTWNFEVHGGHVLVQDQELLAEIRHMSVESTDRKRLKQLNRRTLVAGFPDAWSAPQPASGKQLFN